MSQGKYQYHYRYLFVLALVLGLASPLHAEDPVNGVIVQTFHWDTPGDGNHWNQLPELYKSLACERLITALWIPPAYKGAGGPNDVGYGVYDRYDVGQFQQKGSVRTKYGTAFELQNSLRALKSYGLQIYGDIVLNHMTGADEAEMVEAIRVDWENRNHEIEGPAEIIAYTQFTYPGRDRMYSSFEYGKQHFNGVDFAANLPEGRRKGIFRFVGKSWDQYVDPENGNMDYLMGADLDLDNPEVVRELMRWGRWYLMKTGVDGFRLDAVKHMRFTFYKEWLADLRAYEHMDPFTGKFGKKNLFTVGEYLSYDLSRLRAYTDTTGGNLSLFDFPLRKNFVDASRSSGFYDMGSILNQTMLGDPDLRSLAVTFVDNHDTQPGQPLGPMVDRRFKPHAYALILLLGDGYPCIFAPDLFGAIFRENGNDIVYEPIAELLPVLRARRDFAYGKRYSYFDDRDVVGFTREGTAQHPRSLAVLLSDNQVQAGEKEMFVGASQNPSVKSPRLFRDLTQNIATPVEIDAQNKGRFKVAPGKISVWVEEP